MYVFVLKVCTVQFDSKPLLRGESVQKKKKKKKKKKKNKKKKKK